VAGVLAASDLTYAHPGGDELFREVSFRVPSGRVAGIVGANGVGKSTLLRVLAGELAADPGGTVNVEGGLLRMAQDVGTGEGTVRELLLATAPARLAGAGRAMLAAERALALGDEAAGMALGEAIGTWSELGGYELEGRWDAACRRMVGAGLGEIGDRPSATLSGGERKKLVLDVLLSSEAGVLLLDEPDNFLDIPAKRWLEAQLRASRKTILVISHDRELLAAACDLIVTIEGEGCWVHGGSYATYAEARERRQELMGDRLQAYKDEEQRLRELVRTFKERARYAPDWARRADAMESRWRRHVDAGPPPAPVSDRHIRVRLRGGDSARRAVLLEDVALPGLVGAFSDEVHVGERVGLVGPNGTGKSHLLRLLAGEGLEHTGRLLLGPRVSPGLFTQLNVRSDFDGATPLEVAERVLPTTQGAMNALAAYGLVDAARRPVATLSGGQRARLEVLCLEHEGHNLLLLDEPTDNLDIPSCEALEDALDGFEGTVVAVSHDRRFLRRMDRFLLLGEDGRVVALPDVDRALEALGA
jgi:ATPase subunit of ABC transporter with duplicated ATPase domains